MTKYSLHEIRSAYAQKRDWERQFPMNYYLVRPLSFYVTALVLRVTESPSCVAWFGFAVGLMGCAALVAASRLTIWPGIALLALFAILDAVDGNVARVTRNVTYGGKFLDGVIGEAVEGGCILCAGVGMWLSGQGVLCLLAGAVAICGRWYGSLAQSSYFLILNQQEREAGIPCGSVTDAIKSSRYRAHWWYFVYVNAQVFTVQLAVLSACAALDRTHWFLVTWAIYYVVRAVCVLAVSSYQVYRKLM